MNKKFISIALFAFIMGLSTSNFAISGVPANYKVAVVDVQKVVTSSKQVANLKAEQAKKMEEMKNMIKKAQADIAKETDKAKKEALVKKYENDLSYVKNTNDKNYSKKLTEIDKSISKTIQTESKKAGYDLVLAKGVVLYGGTDITDSISKIVK